jgi:hypothetical protein
MEVSCWPATARFSSQGGGADSAGIGLSGGRSAGKIHPRRKKCCGHRLPDGLPDNSVLWAGGSGIPVPRGAPDIKCAFDTINTINEGDFRVHNGKTLDLGTGFSERPKAQIGIFEFQSMGY